MTLRPMSQSYQPLKTVRVITAPAGDANKHRTVNIRTGAADPEIPNRLQAAGVADTTVETVIYSGGSNVAGVPTIRIAGFTAPA